MTAPRRGARTRATCDAPTAHLRQHTRASLRQSPILACHGGYQHLRAVLDRHASPPASARDGSATWLPRHHQRRAAGRSPAVSGVSTSPDGQGVGPSCAMSRNNLVHRAASRSAVVFTSRVGARVHGLPPCRTHSTEGQTTCARPTMREHAVGSGARVVRVVAAALGGGGAPARRPAIGRDTRLHRGGARRPLRARYVPTTFGAVQSRLAADVSDPASLVDVMVGIEGKPSVGAGIQRLCRAVPSQAHAGQHARSGRAHYDFRVRVHRAAPCRRAMPGPCWLRRLSALPDRFRASPRARNDSVMGCRHLGDLFVAETN